ncbi:NOD1 protein, partial [Atractosteus spatula]|nr:NOD1 protein [Atractosteus spatula]
KGVKLSRQSNVAITMAYLGQLPVKSRDEMKVFQQICGGENICVFKGHLLPGGNEEDSNFCSAPSEENLESGKDTTDETGGRTTEKESCVSSPLFIPVKRSGKKCRRHYQEAISRSTDEDWHCATDTGDCRRQREDIQKKRPEDISAPADVELSDSSDTSEYSTSYYTMQRIKRQESRPLGQHANEVKSYLQPQDEHRSNGEGENKLTGPQNSKNHLSVESQPEELQELEVCSLLQVDDMVAVLEASDLVEQLVLRNTGLTDDLLGCLITALMNSPSEVEMINLNLNNELLKLQHSGERKNFALLELDIGGNKTTSKGLRAYLGLAQSNGADTEGWEEVFNSLKTNNSVSHIILDENCLGDEGAELFAEMLKSNQSLCKVDLDSNGIGERGAHDILEALISRRGCSLEHLSLENNVIGDELLTKIHEQLKPKFV